MTTTSDHSPALDHTDPTAAQPGESTEPSVGLGDLIAPVRGRVALACVVAAFGAIVRLLPFIAVAELGAELLDGGPVDEGRLWGIAWFAVISLAVWLIALFGSAVITHLADNDLQFDLRRRIADRLGRAPLGWFDENDAGHIKKAVIDDVGAMHHLVAHTFTDIVTAIVTPVAAMIYLFIVDWQMGLFVLGPFVIGVLLYARLFSGYGEQMARYNEALDDVNVAAVEFVQGISVVKTFGQSGRAHRRYTDAADRLVDHFLGWVSGMMRLWSLTDVVLSPLTTLAVIAGAGTWQVSRGATDPVDLIVFFLLGLALTAPIVSLAASLTDVQSASAAASRIGVLLGVEALPEPDQPQLPDGVGIEINSVTFSYDGAHRVLDGIDLTIEPGTVTALVGASGSGKSTLAKLLCRFWDPDSGSVRLGGVDISQIDRDVLYRRVGFVFQDVQLLHASVADNIALARPSAHRAEVEAAARAAQIHDRIAAFADGYDTIVGDGAVFSGGEAQRISIARALLADAPILVLDEATAYADPDSEAAVQAALAELVAGRTLIVIAHRLSTIAAADQIVILDRGRVIERGTHAHLLQLDGEYARQWAADQRVTFDEQPSIERKAVER